MEQYILAAIVFLSLLGALYWLKNLYDRSKESGDKEQRLLNLYSNIEDLLDSFEEYVEEVKQEIGLLEKNEQLDAALLKVDEALLRLDTLNKRYRVREKTRKKEPPVTKGEIVKEPKHEEKTLPVKDESYKEILAQNDISGLTALEKRELALKLFKHGMKPNDIARELKLGKGEVNLLIGTKGNKKTKVL